MQYVFTLITDFEITTIEAFVIMAVKTFSDDETFPENKNGFGMQKINNHSNIIDSSKNKHKDIKSTAETGIDNKAYDEDKERPKKPTLSYAISKESVGTFRNKLYGTIDVWWLYDDGGNYHSSEDSHALLKLNMLSLKYKETS